MAEHAKPASRSAARGGPLRRAWIAAWTVFISMAGTTMAYQVYHSIKYGHMPPPLAVLYGVVPLLISICVLEIVAEWAHAPGWAKGAAYAITAGAMYLSAASTGAVVLHAAPPHMSLLFGFLLDGAAILAIHFILNGPRAADARAAAEAERQAAIKRAEADERAALRAELNAAREAHAAERAARVEAQRDAALRAGFQAARDEALAALEAEQDARQAAETARAEAEQRAEGAEAKAERLTRKLGANSGAGRSRNAGAKNAAQGRTTVPNDVDARAQALAILLEEPNITGKELGERCGRGERWGQLRKSELAAHVADGTGAGPEGSQD